MRKKESDIDRMLRCARASQPDLWKRTEAVARIIMPEAFEDGWTIVEPAAARRLYKLRLKHQQSIAMSKAHAVLTHLGVNTEADWCDILQRMAS